MPKKVVTRAECTVELDWFLEGSVLRGTVNAGATECRSRFVIDSPESEQDIVRIIRLAKRGCFAERKVQTAVPLVSTYLINGQASKVVAEGDA
jgi:hypothetical protein